jgi:hypothetical protein
MALTADETRQLKQYATTFDLRRDVEIQDSGARADFQRGMRTRDEADRPIFGPGGRQLSMALTHEGRAERTVSGINDEAHYDTAILDAGLPGDNAKADAFYMRMLADGYTTGTGSDEVKEAAKAAQIVQAIDLNQDNVEKLRAAVMTAGGFDMNALLVTETNGGMPGLSFYRSIADDVKTAQVAKYTGLMAAHRADVAADVKTKVGTKTHYSLAAGRALNV